MAMGNKHQFGPLVRRGLATNTVDAFKTIHRVVHGSDELGSVNDALDLDTVKMGSVVRAHRELHAHAQEALSEHPEEITVYRKGQVTSPLGQDDVVSLSLKPVELYHPQTPYKVNKRDVLTHHSIMGPNWTGHVGEHEVHVLGSKLRPVEGAQ